MKKTTLAIILSLLSAGAYAQQAPTAEKPPAKDARLDRVWRYFVSYDYFFHDDGGKGLNDQLQTKSNTLLTQGYTTTDFSVNTQGAYGARFGALRSLPHHFEAGFSAGYLLGPNMSSNFTAVGGPGPGGLTINRDVIYIRELVQGVYLIPVNKKFSVALGAGLGIATGRVSQGCQSSGTLVCPFVSEQHTWTGFTYEISPSVRYRAGKLLDLRAGPRFAGFPTYSGNANSGRIEYQPFGFFFGALF